VDCMLHGVPVGAGAHDDADLNIFHSPQFYLTAQSDLKNDECNRRKF
jgi:hypothetical protein